MTINKESLEKVTYSQILKLNRDSRGKADNTEDSGKISITIRKLLKIGKRENIEKLLYHGDVYMRHFNDFRKEDIEDNLRGDFAECLAWSPFSNFRFPSFGKQKITIKKAKINEDLDGSHIYSMFMLDDDFWQGKKKIPERILEFGDTALIINPKEFVQRVKSTEKLQIQDGIVDYYNEPLIPKRIDEFSKRKDYEFQNEYRFITKLNTNDPKHHFVGSLEDIAILVPTKSLLEMRFVTK